MRKFNAKEDVLTTKEELGLVAKNIFYEARDNETSLELCKNR